MKDYAEIFEMSADTKVGARCACCKIRFATTMVRILCNKSDSKFYTQCPRCGNNALVTDFMRISDMNVYVYTRQGADESKDAVCFISAHSRKEAIEVLKKGGFTPSMVSLVQGAKTSAEASKIIDRQKDIINF